MILPQASGTDATVRFGEFEVDRVRARVRHNGVPVAIQGKPLQILLALLERPGQLVTREELCNRLWPEDDFGAFEDGLNTAVRKLRIALNDSTETPAFIETVPRFGYRFVAPIEVVADPASQPVPTGSGGADRKEAAAELPPISPGRWWRPALALASLALLAAAIWTTQRWRTHSQPAQPAIISLAVLPLTNMTGESAQEYFVDGMTDDLTTSLAQIGGLRVTSETSARLYRGTNKSVPEIARDLGVDGIVEGAVARSGNRVRVTAQLIDARNDRHLWAESYERDLKDIFALQNEIARTIADKVEAVVTPAEEERMRPQEVKPEAYEAYLRGQTQLEKWTTSGSTEAMRYFEHAIALDDRFALAYVGLAEAYTSHPGVAGVRSSEAMDRAMDALMKAIELKPEMGEAHVMLGGVRMEELDFAGAEAEMRKGVALSPSYGSGHHWYSHLLMYLGRYDESIVEAKKMLELDPLSPAANLHMGYTYEAMRDWDHAIEQMHKTLSLDPNYVDAHEILGRGYLGKGMDREGVAELRRAAELVHTDSDPDYAWHAGELGYALAKSGNTAEAKRILAGIPKSKPAAASCVYAGLGDRDKSIALLTKAFRQKTFPLDAGFLVQYDSLRSDPRFSELLHRVGLR
jgi:TolB-like protein/DNA-binding winged helix-turn-helix (wHTH) protein